MSELTRAGELCLLWLTGTGKLLLRSIRGGRVEAFELNPIMAQTVGHDKFPRSVTQVRNSSLNAKLAVITYSVVRHGAGVRLLQENQIFTHPSVGSCLYLQAVNLK